MIQTFELKYINNIVDTHLASFQGFFLSFLGKSFLNHFYEGIVESDLGIGFVYIDNSKIVGFVCGARNPSEFYRELLRKKWFNFCFASVKGILKKPQIIPRIARAVFYPSSNPRGDNKAMLFSIGVVPSHQNKNIGKKLVEIFLNELKKKGVKEVSLTTDRLNNEKVNEFYRKLGFSLKRFYTTPEGREMNEYVREL